jgi:hypothetical protein
LKPQTKTRSPHDRQTSNTRFDNNSVRVMGRHIQGAMKKQRQFSLTTKFAFQASKHHH